MWEHNVRNNKSELRHTSSSAHSHKSSRKPTYTCHSQVEKVHRIYKQNQIRFDANIHLKEILTIQVMVSYQKIFNARPKNTCFSVKGFSCICRRKCISRKWAFCYLYRWWPAHLGGQPPQIQETSSKIPRTLSVSRTLSVNILIGDRPPPPWTGAYSTSWKIPGTQWHFRSRAKQL